MTMNENQYLTACDEQLQRVEELLDTMIDADMPLDYESGDGMLTIICADTQTPVILSRQRPLQQIWVAAQSGGYHLEFVDGVWQTTQSVETMGQLLTRTCTEQSHQALDLLAVDKC